FEEALALGHSVQATACGGVALEALLWHGRLDEVDRQLEELGALGAPAAGWHWRFLRPGLLLARGDATAADLGRGVATERRGAGWKPWDTELLAELELRAMVDDLSGAV